MYDNFYLGTYTFDHTTGIYLFDKAGTLRLLPGSQDSATFLAEDINNLSTIK
jgi:cytochrome oxidase Cu insertion factor (SCO1/SenC/PrrC family)